eukprot:GHUV01052646.1.p1 GENE.GHUV01052646.1~~GHUV01052646.1.p1  ORF type:complete len:114 (-),score=16.61 GHUV01052646.1:191-532(-)
MQKFGMRHHWLSWACCALVHATLSIYFPCRLSQACAVWQWLTLTYCRYLKLWTCRGSLNSQPASDICLLSTNTHELIAYASSTQVTCLIVVFCTCAAAAAVVQVVKTTRLSTV